MDEVNTYKVNNLLKGVPDVDLVAELKHRGYEVYKWDDIDKWNEEDLEDWGLDVWDGTDEQLGSVINELTKDVK